MIEFMILPKIKTAIKAHIRIRKRLEKTVLIKYLIKF